MRTANDLRHRHLGPLRLGRPAGRISGEGIPSGSRVSDVTQVPPDDTRDEPRPPTDSSGSEGQRARLNSMRVSVWRQVLRTGYWPRLGRRQVGNEALCPMVELLVAQRTP